MNRNHPRLGSQSSAARARNPEASVRLRDTDAATHQVRDLIEAGLN
jgi:hypothetical protein